MSQYDYDPDKLRRYIGEIEKINSLLGSPTDFETRARALLQNMRITHYGKKPLSKLKVNRLRQIVEFALRIREAYLETNFPRYCEDEAAGTLPDSNGNDEDQELLVFRDATFFGSRNSREPVAQGLGLLIHQGLVSSD